MSSALSINGKNLVPIKEVLGRTEYTRDYISKLAREGQIVAAQIGRQWYVDETSLKNFTEASAMEAQLRRQQLSQERRLERDLKQEVTKHFDIIAIKQRRSVAPAVLQTLLIVFSGLGTGYLIGELPDLNPGIVLVQKAQTMLPTTTSVPDPGVVAVGVPTAEDFPSETIVLEQVTFSSINEVTSLRQKQNGVLLLAGANTSTATSVVSMFSDPVEVAFNTETAGEITFANASRTIPFVVVPVPAAATGTVEIEEYFNAAAP